MVSAAHSPTPALLPATSPPPAPAAASLRLVEIDTRTTTHPHIESLSVSARRRLRPVLTTLHGVLGVAAFVGAGMLVADPSGALVGLSTAQLSGFSSFLIPGLVLAALGMIQLAAAFYTTRPGAAPMTASHWAGALAVLFIAFQSALVGPILAPSMVFGAAGVIIYSLAHELHRDEPHTPMLQ